MRTTWWRRIAALGCVVLGTTAVAAAPAQATLSPASPISIQLSGRDSGNNTVLVGSAVGSLAFDDSNTWYRLSVTVCRQGSYSFPNFRVLVNGANQYLYVNENNARPEVCAGYPGYPANGTLDGDFPYGGTIYNITVCLQGVLFTYPAKFPERCVTYDNPFS